MGAKRFNCMTYSIPLESGEIIVISCSSARSGDHISQRAEARWRFHQWKGYARYWNRPWERFPYETAIDEFAEMLYKHGERSVCSEIKAWIAAHYKAVKEEAEKQFEDFKSEYSKLSDGMKDALKSMPPMETEQDMKSTLAIMKMANILNGNI